MQSLLKAVKSKFKSWPEDESYFTCDPDGEVRGSHSVDHDFYPEIEIYESERSSECGKDDSVIITKEMFESN